MSQNIQYHVSKAGVTVCCTNPRARCLLYSFFAPLKNMRVLGTKKGKERFECTVFLRNRTEYNVEEGKAAVLDVMKQVCPQCQKQRQR